MRKFGWLLSLMLILPLICIAQIEEEPTASENPDEYRDCVVYTIEQADAATAPTGNQVIFTFSGLMTRAEVNNVDCGIISYIDAPSEEGGSGDDSNGGGGIIGGGSSSDGNGGGTPSVPSEPEPEPTPTPTPEPEEECPQDSCYWIHWRGGWLNAKSCKEGEDEHNGQCWNDDCSLYCCKAGCYINEEAG